MLINIESIANSGDIERQKWLLELLVVNLKELKQRHANGETHATTEFFDVFVFNNN